MRAKLKLSEIQLKGGVDLHKVSFHVHIVDQFGRKCASGKIGTTEEEIKRYFEPFRGYDLEIAVEIGNPTFWFCDILNGMGVKTYIVNTYQNSIISRSKKKTDKRDARQLAKHLLKDNLPEPVYKPNRIQRQLRTLLSHRHQYVKDRTRLVNRTHSFLSRYGIRVKKNPLKGNLKYWEELFFQLKDVDSFIMEELRLYHEDLKRLMANIKDTEYRMHRIIKAHYIIEYKRLLTIFGIGPIIAAGLIASIGDWRRFKSGKSLVAYFGLAPSVRQTGDRKLSGHGSITREGSTLIRSYLTQGALSIIRDNNVKARALKEWYEKIKQRRGWKKARIALVRKLCGIVFAVVKNETDFDPLLLCKNSKPAG